ncbi:unnamed protein product [Amaranthus hypochondriacus]
MERPYSLSRPPQFSKPKPPPFSSSASSSFHNNGGLFSTSSYDDVFGGPPKFASASYLAPRDEDYSEIFGGFRLSSSFSSTSYASSSIPVLDLPAVPDDLHTAAAFFDYSDVFGGFNAVDFAVCFDELFRPCDDSFCDDDGDGDDFSDEAWTPAGSESHSDDSDPFAYSEKCESLFDENAHQPTESKQFNVSYHKVNPGTSTYLPNSMHVTQLNDVPGYTFVVDEDMTSDICAPVVDDIVLTMGSPSHITQNHTRKTRSHASCNDFGLRSGKACRASTSSMNSTFASVSNINLRTEPSNFPPPSRPPLIVEDRSGDFSEQNSGPIASERNELEAIVDGGLPSFFDMEVDANSSAAVSAAATKNAMVGAQVKLRSLKELRNRKDRVQSSVKLHLETGVNDGEKFQGLCDESLSGVTGVHTNNDRGPAKIKVYSKAIHSKSTSQNLLDILGAEQCTGVSGKPAAAKQGKKSCLSKDTAVTDEAAQWKEARQCYEFVSGDNTRLDPHLHKSNGDAKTAIMQQGDDDHNSDSAEETFVIGGNRRRLKATKVVSRQEYYEKMVKVAQEVHDNMTCGHVDPGKRKKHMSQGNLKQEKPEPVYGPENLQIPLCKAREIEETFLVGVREEEAWKKSNNLLDKDDNMKKSGYRNAEGRPQRLLNEASTTKQAELGRSGDSKRYEDGYHAQETARREFHEMGVEESFERQRTESRVAESPKHKRNMETRGMVDKNSKESSKGLLTGDKVQSACESEEKDNKNDLQRMEVTDTRLEESSENVSGRNRLQACENQDDNESRDMLHREEFENHLEEAVQMKESKKTLKKGAELDEGQKIKEFGKQSIEVQRLYESCNLTAQNDKSEEGQIQSDNKEKLVKTSELEHVVHVSLQECKLEKVNCNYDQAIDDQGLNTMLEKCDELEKSEKTNEVSKQTIELPRLAEASNLIIKNKNTEDVLKENKERLEKATEPKHKSLHKCELEKPRKINGNTESKEDWRDADRRHVNIDWDEDLWPNSSPDIEILIQDNNLNSSNGTNVPKDTSLEVSCKLKRPLMKTDDSKEVSQKENNEIHTLISDRTSTSEAAKTSDSVINEKKIEPEAVRLGPECSELEERTFNVSNTLGLHKNNIETGSTSTGYDHTVKDEIKKVSQLTSEPSLEKDLRNEVEGKRNVVGEGQVLYDKEEKNRSNLAEGINGSFEHASTEEVTCNLLLEGNRGPQKVSHPPSCDQSLQRKGMLNNSFTSEVKDIDIVIDMEKECLRKLEEERERLREREKDRMAVELAVHEARDRSYVDARDRAERAALERATNKARQRELAQARERLEKVCAEAREKSLADKTSEARLRAERAAVERATAEARQRAMEKAKAERTTFVTRDRMQRCISEIYFSERETMIRQGSFPTIIERFEASNGEPAQRCQARLERHRRTVERVAKALAEKNMRDILVQREQEERTRLAETLDVDIRRWSSGKEGNLRALLSTLQYILGPDSGWQPIPLTEVITAAAVKKAYRKATLCVHPDKLQQRGASIQQKYICEKVFDLLKEAWNRFNSEEK